MRAVGLTDGELVPLFVGDFEHVLLAEDSFVILVCDLELSIDPSVVFWAVDHPVVPPHISFLAFLEV